MTMRPKQAMYLGDADLNGVSYQSWPDTDKPFKIRGRIETPRSVRGFAICMDREQAAQVRDEIDSFLRLGLEPPGEEDSEK